MKVRYSPRFKKRFKKLPQSIRESAIDKIELFINEPFHSSLDTHKLIGELDGFWAFSINYRYRIIFEFMNNGSVSFHTVGGHEIYKR